MDKFCENRLEAADEQPEVHILFQSNAAKPPVWYDLGAPFGALLTSLAMLALCILMMLDSKTLPKICGVVTLIAYGLYVARYAASFVHSRRLRTISALLTGDLLEVSCRSWTKRFPVKDLTFSMSYSSSTNLCIIAATEDDFLTISCSCGFLFAKGGKEALAPFYALNKQFMQWNSNHINYVRNKRYRKQNPFKVPMFVFETEYDSPRTAKLISELRARYPFQRSERPSKNAQEGLS